LCYVRWARGPTIRLLRYTVCELPQIRSSDQQKARVVVLGTCTGTRSVLKYHFQVLVLVLVLGTEVLVLVLVLVLETQTYFSEMQQQINNVIVMCRWSVRQFV